MKIYALMGTDVVQKADTLSRGRAGMVMARPTRGRALRRSTWRGSGTCRSCSSARTTTTVTCCRTLPAWAQPMTCEAKVPAMDGWWQLWKRPACTNCFHAESKICVVLYFAGVFRLACGVTSHSGHMPFDLKRQTGATTVVSACRHGHGRLARVQEQRVLHAGRLHPGAQNRRHGRARRQARAPAAPFHTLCFTNCVERFQLGLMEGLAGDQDSCPHTFPGRRGVLCSMCTPVSAECDYEAMSMGLSEGTKRERRRLTSGTVRGPAGRGVRKGARRGERAHRAGDGHLPLPRPLHERPRQHVRAHPLSFPRHTPNAHSCIFDQRRASPAQTTADVQGVVMSASPHACEGVAVGGPVLLGHACVQGVQRC